MGEILTLLAVLVFIYIIAYRMGRYPWPWLSLVLILFIIMSTFMDFPHYANIVVAGLIGFVVMKKVDYKVLRSSEFPPEKPH